MTERKCPRPFSGDDGSVAQCIANGHCGCDEKPEYAARSTADRMKAEAEFERSLREYVLNPGRKRLFWGVCNLLGMVASICEEQSELEGDDWTRAAEAIDDCASAVDLKYSRDI